MAAFGGVVPVGVRLDTARLRLRRWQASDAEDVAAIMADATWRPFLDVPDPYPLAAARTFVADAADRSRADRVALAVMADDRLVGSIDLVASDPAGGGAHIGYWTAPASQGRGCASEAVGALAGWGFTHGVHRIEITCDVRNLASARVAMRAGFAFEAVRRDDYHFRGAPRDSAVFVRLAGDTGAPVPRSYPPLPDGALTDGVVLLRVPEPDDLTGFAEQERDPITVEVGFTGVAPSLERMQRQLDRDGLDFLVGPAAAFTIVDAQTGRFAGGIRLRPGGPPGVGGLGYVVHPAFRGRGYTTRALLLVASWAFEQVGLARLELGAKVDNVASQKAALAAGFRPDGIRRTRLRNPDGSYGDEARFALINPRHRTSTPGNT